ncbi:hypothetical protein ASD11_10295 [Aeromicrobium sp. Root495]|nr:hypothetical protein ASD11_10295 [Aeromicrobium sp. Root495]
MVAAAITLVALTCVAFLVPVPYVTLRPGPVFDTLGDFDGKPMFTFGKGVKTYKTDGSLDFTTVSVTRADSSLSLVDVTRAYLDQDIAVVPHDFVYPDDQSESDAKTEGQAQLTSSKDASRVAALRAAGYTVPEKPVVAGVVKDSAAAGKLEAKDRIVTVDGTKVASSAAVVKAIQTVKPGQVVTVGVDRDGKALDVELTTRPDAQDPTIPRVGITIATTYDFPIDIVNNVGDQVGGPSAGTMFALAIYDRLTPGSLTGGLQVAGTGEITADGTVGPIGGIRQKMAGAAAAGAEVFLAPASNCDEVRGADLHGLEVVKVSTLKDAITDLRDLAQDKDATVPRC